MLTFNQVFFACDGSHIIFISYFSLLTFGSGHDFGWSDSSHRVFVVFGNSTSFLADDEEVAVQAIAEIPEVKALIDSEGIWQAPDWASVDAEPNADEIKYGKELIANTAEYLGPKGKVRKMSNGMNCQNCHLQAGAAPLGNNYSAVAATYPKVRARSGQSEDIPKRINDCFERSLNGKASKTIAKK
ncbi:hypothetical protein GHT06_003568 [Daphnia sinensis]|uniref:Cytochrome c domain-containing protein n=1 Tax=Daphnia sinensis TaxID=1820382 RepID=A0AAD5KUP7_9CRUS|nr:hypothetical protein GHT06_003568 [Daphnia sinensis]